VLTFSRLPAGLSCITHGTNHPIAFPKQLGFKKSLVYGKKSALRDPSQLNIACSLISVIALLDCAMRIYSNYPCRMTLAELENDLPCKETIFSSRHPFMQDDSIFAPRITVSEAFSLLFQRKSKLAVSSTSTASDQSGNQEDLVDSEDASTKCDLTVFDLFILIHCEEAYPPPYSLTYKYQNKSR